MADESEDRGPYVDAMIVGAGVQGTKKIVSGHQQRKDQRKNREV